MLGPAISDPLDWDAKHAKNGSPEENEGEGDEPIKPLFWIASSKDDLRAFPEVVKDVMGFALYQAQTGGNHIAAKPLKGFGGAGVLEIVEDNRGSTFRGVYTVKFAGVVYVLDAFQKKSKKGTKTPKGDIDRIKKRLKAAEDHHEKWLASQQEQEEDT